MQIVTAPARKSVLSLRSLVALAPLVAGACTVNHITVESDGSSEESAGLASTSSSSGTSTTGEAGEDTSDPVPLHCAESAQATIDILTAKCAKCHSGDSPQPAGSINYITSLDTLITEGKVVPGRPLESRIFIRMSDEVSPMPPLAEATRPSADDIATVERWISECAGKSSCSEQPFISVDEMLTAILTDVSNNVDLEKQQFTRYFSFVHLYNTGWCDAEIEVYRQALSKLVNSLSSETKIREPIAVDERRLIYRIDIRDYGWSKALWDQTIAAGDPYAVEYIQDTADKIKSDVGTRLFVLMGDSFLAFSSRPPLYHEILDIPQTRFQLEARFGINVEENIKAEKIDDFGRVGRAGFHKSDVSFFHRMIERHEFPDASNRVYWISYDFAGNDGTRNFFSDPFSFKEDGGEIIFNLPNGLQGYMLVDGAGNRLDTAPPNVVKDKNQEDGIVVNGVSCMGCHSKGMIMADDDVRYEIDNGGGAGIFDAQEKLEIQRVFPKREDFRALMIDDSERFIDAAAKTGAPADGDKEPILTVFLAFDEDIKLRRAAAELGLTAADFQILIGSLSTNDLDDLRKPDTAILRDVFTANFAQIVCDLKLGLTSRCPDGF